MYLDLAKGPSAVRLARLAASDLAARIGFDVDEIEDLCRAVEELCTAVLGGPPDEGRLQVWFRLDASALTVEGRGTGTVAAEDGEARGRLLDAFLDEHQLGDPGSPTFRALKRRGEEP